MSLPPSPTEPAPVTLGDLFRRAAGRALLVVALIAIAVVIYAAWWRRGQPPSHVLADETAWCHARYATARTAAESSAVDSERVPRVAGGPSAQPLCREVRLAHH